MTVETLGYITRASSANKTDQITPFIQQTANFHRPVLFAASIYMTLGRIMRTVEGEEHSVIRINWLVKISVCGDIFSFIIQGGGARMMANNSTVKTREYIVLGGLGLRTLSFGLFFLCAIISESRMARSPTRVSLTTLASWKVTLRMLYVVSILIRHSVSLNTSKDTTDTR